MPKKHIATAMLALAALATTNAFAAPLSTYSDNALFNAAISNAATDTYSTLTTGTSFSGPVTRTVGSYSYSVTTTDNILYQGLSADGFLTNNNRTNPIVFSSFSGGATAIGANFFGSLITGTYAPGLNLTLTINEFDGDVFTTSLNNTSRESFFGYIGDSAITGISVTGLTTDFWPSIDNLTLAQLASNNVAEPESIMLLGLALLGLGISRRRTSTK